MRALDTNLLVRFLVGDDAKQTKKICRMLERAQEDGETFLVVSPVLLEMFYVLKSAYGFSRGDVLDAVEGLAALPALEFEPGDMVNDLVRIGRSTKLDLSDVLIGLCGRQAGCETTLTLDKKTARSDLLHSVP